MFVERFISKIAPSYGDPHKPYTASDLAFDGSDIKGILKEQVNQVDPKKPGSLPPPESTLPVHENEGAEGVKDEYHGWEVEIIKVGWNR